MTVYKRIGSKEAKRQGRKVHKNLRNTRAAQDKMMDTFCAHWNKDSCVKSENGATDDELTDDLIDIFDAIWQSIVHIEGGTIQFRGGEIYFVKDKGALKDLKKGQSKEFKKGVDAVLRQLKS